MKDKYTILVTGGTGFMVSKNFLARDEVKVAYADHTKAKDILGFVDKVSLKEGVKKMFDWAKQGGVKESKKFEGTEIKENLLEV